VGKYFREKYGVDVYVYPEDGKYYIIKIYLDGDNALTKGTNGVSKLMQIKYFDWKDSEKFKQKLEKILIKKVPEFFI
jgi:uncharacterized protein (DUF2147 family)